MSKRKQEFAWSPIRRAMKRHGADIVSRDAVSTLIDFLIKRAKMITESSILFAKHAKRKKVSASDLQLAIEAIA